MIFREFFTGSDEDLTLDERKILENLFETQFYVEREIEYSYTSTFGSVNQTAMRQWRSYLEKYHPYIVSGTHFTNFAVQVSKYTIDCNLAIYSTKRKQNPERQGILLSLSFHYMRYIM